MGHGDMPVRKKEEREEEEDASTRRTRIAAGIAAGVAAGVAAGIVVGIPGISSHPPRTEGGQAVLDIGDMGPRVPLEDLQEPLLGGKPQDHFPWRLPDTWPMWLGRDDSHLSKVVSATLVAFVCSLVALFFNTCLKASLEFVWITVPNQLVEPLAGALLWPKLTYMVLTCAFLGLVVGLSLSFLGYPGDLPFLVYCVHYRSFVPLKYFLPMLFCALASIVGGGSLGPEAAIVLMCAGVAGGVGEALGHSGARLRESTLCGMACGFAAFFGVPLGGPFFALEVVHRMGLEYYESISYAVFSGTICCAIFHVAIGEPLGGIWDFKVDLGRPTASQLLQGTAFGVVGAAGAVLFLKVHKAIRSVVDIFGLKRSQILSSTFAGLTLGLIGLLVPQTLFWGEWELQTIIDRGASPLPHIWPKVQILPYSLSDPWANLMVALVKMVTISITIHGGFRGGFIFPFFLTGAAIGSAIQLWIPSLDVTIATMCVAASLDVAITRTPFGTALILASLSGQPNILQPVGASALVSLMLTNTKKFQLIKPQRARAWMDVELEHEEYDHTAGE